MMAGPEPDDLPRQLRPPNSRAFRLRAKGAALRLDAYPGPSLECAIAARLPVLQNECAAGAFRLRRLAYVKVVNTHLGTSNSSAQTATGPVTIQDTGINPTKNMLRLPSLSESHSQYMFASNVNFKAPNNRSALALRTNPSGLLSTVFCMIPLT
jgi:hypothetical protein